MASVPLCEVWCDTLVSQIARLLLDLGGMDTMTWRRGQSRVRLAGGGVEGGETSRWLSGGGEGALRACLLCGRMW